MIKVRKLEPTDDRSDFRSGNPDLDRFFIHYAGQNQFRHHIGTTYIAVEGDRILGFVTVHRPVIATQCVCVGTGDGIESRLYRRSGRCQT
jgi:hypothetical protein